VAHVWVFVFSRIQVIQPFLQFGYNILMVQEEAAVKRPETPKDPENGIAVDNCGETRPPRRHTRN
jgi:hypothetical protein